MFRCFVLLSALLPALAGCTSATTDSVWDPLGRRYDRDADGAISRAEYPRDDVRFARLDRDADGEITRKDFDVHYEKSVSHHMVWAGQMVLSRHFQRDDDPWVVTLDEVRAAFGEADRTGDGRLSSADAGEPPALSDRVLDALVLIADRSGDGVVSLVELTRFFLASDIDGDGLLTFRRDRKGVDPGTPAPDFRLPPVEGGEPVTLSSLRGRPVALVFGCYT